MIRISTFIAVPFLVIAAWSGLAQTIDTARVRTAYAKVVAVRAEIGRSHGRFVAVNGIRMHYLEWGKQNGIPLVWAHGSASSGYEIRAVAPRLAEAGYRVLAVDYRGHGQTRVRDYDFGIYHIADEAPVKLVSRKIEGSRGETALETAPRSIARPINTSPASPK